MNNIRPFQLVVMGIFGILALVGLVVFSTFSGFGEEGTTAIGPVEIWGTIDKNAVAGAIDALKAVDKGYSSVTYTYVRPESFSSDLANALAAGSGPDLILISQEQLAKEISKIEVIPSSSISERTFRETYATEFELYLTSTGTYGIPLMIDPLVLYYNRGILASAGIASPPSTWEAVSGLVPKLTTKSGSDTVVKATIPFGSYGNVTNARAILSALFLQAGSGITEWGRDGITSNLGYANAAAGDATASALSFYTQFADPVKSLYTWSPAMPASRQAFLAGDLAFYPGFASEARGLAAANPNLDFDMTSFPQPAVANRKATYGLAYAFSIPKVSDNQSGAYQTAMALGSASIMPAMVERTGMAPARKALLDAPPDDLYSPIVYPQAIAALGWLSPVPLTVDAIFAGMILNVTSGRTSTAEALSNAAQSLDAALRQ